MLKKSTNSTNSPFFDPVRGDSFDPEDEIPWICGSEEDDDDRNPMLMGAGGSDPEDR